MAYRLISSGDLSDVLMLADVKKHIRILHDVEDYEIEAYLKSSVDRVQRITKVALVTQTWKYTTDCWPADYLIHLEQSPVTSVTHVKYYDEDGVQQTLATTKYQTDLTSMPARVYITDVPALETGIGRIEIQFVTGPLDVVPEDLLHAIRMFTAGFYCDRLEGGKRAGSQVSSADRYMTAAEQICKQYSAYQSLYTG